MLKKIFYLVLVTSIFLAGCSAPTTPTVESTKDVVHLKVGYQPFLISAPLFIAKESGYFAEQGLDVELVSFTSSADMRPALLSGDLDADTEPVTPGNLNAVMNGDGLKFVAEQGFIDPKLNCVEEGLVVRTDLLKDGYLDTANHIRGLKVALTKGTVFEYGLDVQLQKFGLTQDDLQVVEIPQQASRLEGLSTGALDLVTFAEPWINRVQTKGVADVWVPFKDLTPNMPFTVIIFGSDLMKNTDVGNRFMVAYLKAVSQYNEGKTDRNVAILAQYTQLSSEDINASCWAAIAPDGQLHAEALSAYEDWLIGKSYLEAKPTLEQIWDPKFVNYADGILK